MEDVEDKLMRELECEDAAFLDAFCSLARLGLRKGWRLQRSTVVGCRLVSHYHGVDFFVLGNVKNTYTVVRL